MHVAYAALEAAVQKVGDFDPSEDDLQLGAKRLLQKCAYAVISRQELPAQQVSSYLMDFGDHYSSDALRNLYWRTYERHIEWEWPSPECCEHESVPDDVEDENSGQSEPEPTKRPARNGEWC